MKRTVAHRAEPARTLRLSVQEGLVWSLCWGFGEVYIHPYAIFLQASPTIIALLGTLPGLLGALGQLLGAEVMMRLGRRRPLVVASTTIQALSFAPLYLLPFLFPDAAGACVLVTYSVALFLFSGGAPVWTSLMSDVAPPEERGRYFGHRARVVIAAMTVSMLAASWVLSRFKAAGQELAGFGVLFLVAMVARLICAGLLHRHADPPLPRAEPVVLADPGLWRRLRRSPFAYFVLVQTLLNGAFALAAPFFGLYMLRDLHWSYQSFTIMTLVFFVAQMVVAPWWGALADRHGSRVVFQATCLLLPLPHVAWFLTTDFHVLLVAQILNGALTSGLNLASGNYLFDSVSPAQRARVMSHQSLLAAVVNLGAGLAGAALARSLPATLQVGPIHLALASNLPLVILSAGLLRMGLTLLLLPHVREVRSVEPARSRDIIRRFATGEPLLQQMTQLAARIVVLRNRETKARET